MILHLPRKLLLRLVGALVLAFVLSLGVTWRVQTHLADRNAYTLIDRILNDVQGEAEDEVNLKLILTAMVVRDRLPTIPDPSVETLRALAEELRVDEVTVVGARGIVIGSNRAKMLGRDFHSLGAAAAPFLRLLDEETEVTQRLLPDPIDGDLRKRVGVWIPAGGFVVVGCRPSTLRSLTLTAITGLAHNRHVGDSGAIVVTTGAGLVVSSTKEMGLVGSLFQMPSGDHYVVRREIESYPVYAILPKSAAVSERNTLVGTSAILTAVALLFVAILVGVAIARYVREQVEQRMADDLRLARSIQAGSLPNVFPPYPTHADAFDIFAMMRPARVVGGDFYDFYHVSHEKLALVIADVTGKGVPAAMYMMRAKTTLKAHLVANADLAEMVNRVNAAIAEGNDDNIFVTAWIGIVDLRTGHVEYVNAGHNPPLVRSANGKVRWLAETDPDLPLAAVVRIPYVRREFRLRRGDTLFLYTDGIAEAMNADRELFGDDRLAVACSTAPKDSAATCRAVVAAADAFAAGAPQADDMTCLAYRFLAPITGTVRETFRPDLAALARCAELVESAGLGPEASVILDEVVSNIVRCSGATEFVFEITVDRELVFTDDGRPFDPTRQDAPDTDLDAMNRPIGGLGIYLVRNLAESVTYARKDGRNVLTVRLKR